MIRRPPRSTRTDTLFPYTTLFRSWKRARPSASPIVTRHGRRAGGVFTGAVAAYMAIMETTHLGKPAPMPASPEAARLDYVPNRSEERRVGKEWVRTGRSRWSPDH